MAKSLGQRRWPWLVLSIAGLLLSVGFLLLRFLGSPKLAPPADDLSAPAAPSAASAAAVVAQPPPPQSQPPPPRTVSPAKLSAAAAKSDGATPGRASDGMAAEGAGLVASAPKKMRTAHREASSRKAEPSSPPASKPSATRSLEKSDSDDVPAISAGPIGPSAAESPKTHGGHGGHGKGVKKGKSGGAPPSSSESEPSREVAAGESAGASELEPAGQDDSGPDQMRRLLPGYFAVKVPKQMLLKRPVRVHVTISDKASKERAESTLKAAPSGGIGGATVSTADVLIGRQIQVELRALPTEFEILAITPRKQLVHPGHVAMWSWAVVPQSEGEHELSVVVTNLTDKNGNAYDLTVHEVLVNVEVQTMDKLRAVASTVSSAVSGLLSLLGAWMGLLRPLLKRRREEEEAKQESRPKSTGSSGSDAPQPDKESGAASSADPANSSTPSSVASETEGEKEKEAEADKGKSSGGRA